MSISDTEQLTPDFAGVGTADLSTSIAETAEGDHFKIHGVALGAGDITVGQSEIKKYWPAEALREAAESLEGRPLVKNHTNNAEGRIGTVTKADYKTGVGVVYEAEIAPHYEELAKDVAAGILDVSARVKHPDEEELEQHEDSDALVVDRMLFDNLSVVTDGASPSNTANYGASPELSPDAGQAEAADSPAVASASAGDEGDFATATLERGYVVEDVDVTSDMNDDGAEDEPEAEDEATDDVFEEEESDADVEDEEADSEPDVDAEDDSDSGTESEEAEELETGDASEADGDELEADADDLGDEAKDTAETEEQSDSPTTEESESTDVEADTDEAGETSAAETRDESGGLSPESVAALSTYTPMNPDFTEDIDEDAIEEMSEPVLVERDTVEQLSEKAETAETVDERLEELNEKVDVVDQVDDDALEELAEAEDPVVLESEELSEKEGLVDEVGSVYAEELAKDSQFSAEELTDRFSPMELRDKLAGEDGDAGEELASTIESEPEPEGETVESEELSESAEDIEREETEEMAREKVAEELEDVGWTAQAEKVRAGEMDLEELGVEIE